MAVITGRAIIHIHTTRATTATAADSIPVFRLASVLGAVISAVISGVSMADSMVVPTAVSMAASAITGNGIKSAHSQRVHGPSPSFRDCRQLFLHLNAVAPQGADVADVEPSVRDDGICPRFFHLVDALRLLRRREAPLLAVRLG